MPGGTYVAANRPILRSLGISGSVAAILIFVLFLIEDAVVSGRYASAAWLWIVPPVLFVWIGRVWLLVGRAQLRYDPVEFAVRDLFSIVCGCLVVGAVALATNGAGVG